MKYPVLMLAFMMTSMIVLSSCGSKNQNGNSNHTIEKFMSSLSKGMKHNDILQQYGQPDKDIGSGIHIYVYHLDDGSAVRIGCTDELMYARQVDSTGAIIQHLVE